MECHGQCATAISWRHLERAVYLTAVDLINLFDANPNLPRRIGHASDNSGSDIVLALASILVGSVEIPIDHRLASDEIQRRFRSVGGHWIGSRLRKRIDERLRCMPQDPAANIDWENDSLSFHFQTISINDPSLILWTSGTTDRPQGVTLSQKALTGNAKAKLAAVPQESGDIRLTVLPLSHAYARTCDFGTWLISGCTLAITLGYSGLKRMAAELRPHLINSVPSIAYRLLAENPVGIDRLRLLGCGGAPVSKTAFLQWKDRGVTVIQGYGLTETGPVICSATPKNALPGLVGGFVDGWESKVIHGELFVRGPHTMLHYWNDEVATGRKMDTDGWLATGDLVEQDELSGQLRVLGRLDDVIVLDSGAKISPSIVEREIERIEGVSHALLHQQNGLHLWFDTTSQKNVKSIRNSIAKMLRKSFELRDCTIHEFSPRLAESAGELTAKGTIRRKQIVKQRLAGHAGS